MIHACGHGGPGRATWLTPPTWSPAARAALRAGAPILCDADDGRGRASPARGCPPATRWSARCATRACRRWPPSSAPPAAPPPWSCGATGSTVPSSPIGNAPTALFRLLDMIEAGAPRPAAVLGIPVGFIGAAESKAGARRNATGLDAPRRPRPARRSARSPPPRSTPWPASRSERVTDRRTAGTPDRPAVRGRARPRRPGAGHRQGRPDSSAAADVIAYHCARHGRSIARVDRRAATCAAGRSRSRWSTRSRPRRPTTRAATGARSTTSTPRPPQRLAAHLDAGRDVVVLAEGDPLFYGSYMHMHKRLADRYPTRGRPRRDLGERGRRPRSGGRWSRREEVLTVLPGTLPAEELAARLAATDSAAVLKLGRTFGNGPRALAAAGRLDEAWYVERATMAGERTAPLAEVEPDSVPYFSLALLPEPRRPRPAPAASAERPGRAGRGQVVVVGLGPAGPRLADPGGAGRTGRRRRPRRLHAPTWTGCPPNPRQRRHASDNKVEAERAEFALDLALRGRRVAVVSSGDPGVFAMATAVLEVAAAEVRCGRPVRVLPGADRRPAPSPARVGAPLGHDYAVISLSDRLKPWEVDRRAAARRRAGRPGASRSTTRLRGAAPGRSAPARELLLEHRAPDTPVVVGRDVGGAGRADHGSPRSPSWTRQRSTCAPAAHRLVRRPGRAARDGDGGRLHPAALPRLSERDRAAGGYQAGSGAESIQADIRPTGPFARATAPTACPRRHRGTSGSGGRRTTAPASPAPGRRRASPRSAGRRCPW